MWGLRHITLMGLRQKAAWYKAVSRTPPTKCLCIAAPALLAIKFIHDASVPGKGILLQRFLKRDRSIIRTRQILGAVTEGHLQLLIPNV